MVFTGIMLNPMDSGSSYDYIDNTNYTESATKETRLTQSETNTKTLTDQPTQ